MSGKKITKFTSHSPDETLKIGRQFAQTLKPGVVVRLYGDLGSGKTVFVKGVCAGVKVNDDVTSPSFVIATEYRGSMPVSHIDLYRLDNDATADLHLEEYIVPEGITLIEWADRLNNEGDESIIIRITILDPVSREIVIEDPRY
jgi:tRNA threonylcarbamoyladenosine biosynthesis protein TsaE